MLYLVGFFVLGVLPLVIASYAIHYMNKLFIKYIPTSYQNNEYIAPFLGVILLTPMMLVGFWYWFIYTGMFYAA